MDVTDRIPKPPELIGLSLRKMTPDQRKIYYRWQYDRHGPRKRAGMKRYRESNPDKRRASLEKWREANKEYCCQYMRDWYAKHPEVRLKYKSAARAKWLADPKRIEREALKQEQEEKHRFEKSLAEALKLSLNLHWEERRKIPKWKRRTQANPILKIRSNIRGRIYRQLKGRRKKDSTMKIIGCSMADLKRHLESQFKARMSWENYGRVWHVDHIVPSSYFDLTEPEEIRRCYHFSNLRPLWAKKNMQEADRRGPLTPFLGI